VKRSGRDFKHFEAFPSGKKRLFRHRLQAFHAHLFLGGLSGLHVENFPIGKIGHEAPFGMAHGMADIITHRRAFSANFTYFRHNLIY